VSKEKKIVGPFFVRLNGVGYEFGERPPLKGKNRVALPAKIGGKAGTVVVIASREFDENRVWVSLPNGVTGRFLVPKSVDLSGNLEIEVVAGAVKYDREAIRVRPVVRRAKMEVVVEEAKVEA
jgi:hypothetical protein